MGDGTKEFAVVVCYHCGNKTMMEKIATHLYSDEDVLDEDEYGRSLFSVTWGRKWELFICPVCNEVSLRRSSWFSEETDHTGRPIETSSIIYPAITRNSQNMPKKVYGSFEAAIKVRHIDGAICVLSLRRTLEMMCKDRGETGHDLYTKLKRLADKGTLPPILGEMAQLLKKLGNAAAHADDADFPTEIVEPMIDFTQTILDYVYNLPQSLADIQSKLAKPKSSEEIVVKSE